METGFIITDENGREIGYCDGTREEAEDLRAAIFGDGIIPSEDYEEPEEEE